MRKSPTPLKHNVWYLGSLVDGEREDDQDGDWVRHLMGCDALPANEEDRDLIEVRYTQARMPDCPGIIRHAWLGSKGVTTTGWHTDEWRFTAVREITEEEIAKRIKRRRELAERLRELTTLKRLVAKHLPRVTNELLACYPELGVDNAY